MPNTFWWDTCAPHAILNAIDGGVVCLRPAIRLARELMRASPEESSKAHVKSLLVSRLDELQIRYAGKSDGRVKSNNSFYCNTEGFMAYRSKDMAVDILMHLAKNVDEE